MSTWHLISCPTFKYRLNNRFIHYQTSKKMGKVSVRLNVTVIYCFVTTVLTFMRFAKLLAYFTSGILFDSLNHKRNIQELVTKGCFNIMYYSCCFELYARKSPVSRIRHFFSITSEILKCPRRLNDFSILHKSLRCFKESNSEH